MRKGDNLPPYCTVVKNSRSLIFLDLSGPAWPVTGVFYRYLLPLPVTGCWSNLLCQANTYKWDIFTFICLVLQERVATFTYLKTKRPITKFISLRLLNYHPFSALSLTSDDEVDIASLLQNQSKQKSNTLDSVIHNHASCHLK